MRTQVCIVGGGPAGMLLGQLLHRAGIDTLVLEKKPRDYVLSRIRAGVLEYGSVGMLDKAGVGARCHAEGFPHDGVNIALQNRGFRISMKDLIDKRVVVYGQTEVTHDLYDARDASGAPYVDEAEGVTIHDVETGKPHVTWTKGGTEHRVDCDWVAGCDGYHGVSRQTIPGDVRHEFERVYPFGWLGVLSETPPVSHEILYANHPRGFALLSMRNENLSRYYIQSPADEDPKSWSDDRFWDELRRRIPTELAESLVTGPTIEKSVAPLRSFVCEPMRWGRLLLLGDAAHIVPPTGAKGLNLAIGDVHYAYEALMRHYSDNDDESLDGYSAMALDRVWKSMRFSWWLTTTLHRFPDQSDFDQRMQESELSLLEESEAAQRAMAEQYVGLPY